MIHGDINRSELVQTNMNALWSVNIPMNHKNIENNAIIKLIVIVTKLL